MKKSKIKKQTPPSIANRHKFKKNVELGYVFFETPNNSLLKFPRYTRITQFHPIPSGRGTFAGTNSWKAKLKELATMTKAGSLVTGPLGGKCYVSTIPPPMNSWNNKVGPGSMYKWSWNPYKWPFEINEFLKFQPYLQFFHRTFELVFGPTLQEMSFCLSGMQCTTHDSLNNNLRRLAISCGRWHWGCVRGRRICFGLFLGGVGIGKGWKEQISQLFFFFPVAVVYLRRRGEKGW